MMSSPSNDRDLAATAAFGTARPRRRLAVTGRQAHSLVFTIIFALQFLTLLLPRDGGSAALVYAAPLVTTVALAVTRQFRISLGVLLALMALLVPSLLLVAFGQGGPLNLVLSLATYSSVYLLTLAPTASTDE